MNPVEAEIIQQQRRERMADSKTDDKQETPRADAIALMFSQGDFDKGWAAVRELECELGWERTAKWKLASSVPSARGEGWIPVSERTPEHTDTVLFISASTYKLGHYAAGEWWDNGQEDNWPPAHDVTHWMQLPKKPLYVNSLSPKDAK